MNNIASTNNISYQNATSPLGGSYTEKKLARLGLPSLVGLSFLDLGCNSGFYCCHAAAQGASRVVGVDVDPPVIVQARAACPQGEFHDEGWERLPKGPFDIVIMLSAIHYAEDPVGLIQQVYDRLAPDGLLIIEGGLIDPEGFQESDILVPGWREVGDRCRHLSLGYLEHHVLSSFSFNVFGLSEPRGGDEVTRHVVHARKSLPRPQRSFHVLDLLEFFQGLAGSAGTIIDAQPAHEYVKRLPPNQPVPLELLESILAEPRLRELFITDLAFALEPSRNLPVHIRPTVSPVILNEIVNGLRGYGLSIQVGQT